MIPAKNKFPETFPRRRRRIGVMAQRFRPLSSRVFRLAWFLCAGVLLPSFAAPCLKAAPAAEAPVPSLVAELAARPDAEAAEDWLADVIPPGTALADAPDFFAAASEVFYDADENLVVFVYRSSNRGRWIAWVSFDSERVGVVHTAAIDL